MLKYHSSLQIGYNNSIHSNGENFPGHNNSSFVLFLNILLDGIQKCQKQVSSEELTELPLYTGIYELFRFMGGLSSNCSAHLAEIDLKYQKISFSLRLSSHKKYVFSIHSLHGFKDKRVDLLEKLYNGHTQRYQSLIFYDRKTGQKFEDSSSLSNCRSSKLAVSTLITNVRGRAPLATFRFESTSTKTFKDNIWFMITCELDEQSDSLWQNVKLEMEEIVKCRYWNFVEFWVQVNGQEIRASEYGLLELLKTAYKWRDKDVERPVVINFRIDCHFTIASRQIVHLSEEIKLGQVLEDYYMANSEMLIMSESSTQLLMIEFSADIGVDRTQLCQDIYSPWLEERQGYYYQLRGLIINHTSLDGDRSFVPVVKLKANDWYYPYLNYHTTSPDSLDLPTTYIFERSLCPSD